MNDTNTLNYSGIFLSCFANGGASCTEMVKNHTLTYVYSGEMEIDVNGDKQVIGRNQCVFIRRDNRIRLLKRAKGEKQYRGISLTFQRGVFRDFLSKMPKKEIPKNARISNLKLVKIEPRPDIISLFESLYPYFESNMEPSEEIIRLKEQEGVMALLRTSDDFYSVLFDFISPWKIDIMDFLNENYMYDLSMEEIASFTGRSLATFKRDFAKISELTPQKWIIRRRLEDAYNKLKNENKKASEIYTEVGFKDISHFYHAFKRQYGFSPKKQ